MRKTFFYGLIMLGIIILPYVSNAQAHISYDKSGNRVKMVITVEPISANAQMKSSDIKENEMMKAIEQVSIYPNPVTQILSITNNNDNLQLNASLYDINGKLIRQSDYVKQTTMNIESERAGVYILEIKSESYSKRWKVLKQ